MPACTRLTHSHTELAQATRTRWRRSTAGHAGKPQRQAALTMENLISMTTSTNGQQHVSAFEGAELEPDAQSKAILTLITPGQRHRGRQPHPRGAPTRPRGPSYAPKREVENGPCNLPPGVDTWPRQTSGAPWAC